MGRAGVKIRYVIHSKQGSGTGFYFNSFDHIKGVGGQKQSSGTDLDSLGDHAHGSGILSMATSQLGDLQGTLAFENLKPYAALAQAYSRHLHYPDGPQKP